MTEDDIKTQLTALLTSMNHYRHTEPDDRLVRFVVERERLAELRGRLQSEVWVPIAFYPFVGKYEVSSAGRVRRIGATNCLAQSDDGQGYMKVSLSEGNRRSSQLVHRLVAQAFIENPDNDYCVNHIDGVKRHNWIANLEWCTLAENNIHAIKSGLNKVRGKNNGLTSLTDDDVKVIKSLKGKVTGRSLAKRYSVGESTISGILLGKTWTHIPFQAELKQLEAIDE